MDVVAERSPRSALRTNAAPLLDSLSSGATSFQPVRGVTRQACAVCGFRSSDLGSEDLRVALTSLPHWWRQLFHPDGGRAFLCRRFVPEDWSAIEHGAHVARCLHGTWDVLERVRRRELVLVDEARHALPGLGDNDRDPDVVLDALVQTTTPMVMLVLEMTRDEWGDVGIRNGGSVGMLDLVRESVHEGVHHLREARKVLVDFGATPAADAVDNDIWGSPR